MASPESDDDPYLDPATGLLRNLVGAGTQEELDEIEADLVHAATLVLRERPPRHTRDIREWQAIHRGLFGDVYPWAGEIRRTAMWKTTANFRFQFAPDGIFDTAIPYTEDEIQKAFAGPRMSQTEFIENLARQYNNLNVLHPFREGNGRMQRFFWNRVADSYGFRINWLDVTAEENGEASAQAAITDDPAPLLRLFSRVVREKGVGPDEPVLVHLPSAAPPVEAFLRAVVATVQGDRTCGFDMPRARSKCVLPAGHRGHHRSGKKRGE